MRLIRGLIRLGRHLRWSLGHLTRCPVLPFFLVIGGSVWSGDSRQGGRGDGGSGRNRQAGSTGCHAGNFKQREVRS